MSAVYANISIDDWSLANAAQPQEVWDDATEVLMRDLVQHYGGPLPTGTTYYGRRLRYRWLQDEGHFTACRPDEGEMWSYTIIAVLPEERDA